ncbi:MAG: hypothetical protein KAS71_16230 [Bacteroidales bacterium]|nr:hypothetical protein [Bacteroidales bacterium]
MNKKENSKIENKEFSISEVLSFLKTGLQNISLVNKEVANIGVKKIDLLNNKTLECQFYAKSNNSIDVKIEIGAVMGALHGFFKDDSFKNILLNYYAVRAFNKEDSELMYVISSKEVAASIGQGNSIDWMKSSIFQENTKDYRLSVAKKQISEIENALREIIVDRLSKKHGKDWFICSVGEKLREKVIDTYNNQFGVEIEDGDVLIKYTFVLQLKKIICTNWKDFSDLFSNKIKFEEVISEFNSIRREEAHNRDISNEDLEKLKEIYEFLLIDITSKYPNILPHFLIDNWKIQIKEIMLSNKLEMNYCDYEIQSETNNGLKLVKTVLNLQKLINHIKDKELKLKSVVVPIQKLTLHNELISVLEKYRILHEELVECGKTGVLKIVQDKQREIEVYKTKLDNFTEKFVLNES